MDHLRALRILGLPPGSSKDEIQGAWRDLAKVWHPDRFPQDERLQRKAGENLSQINEAYEALRTYDPTVTPTIAARMRHSVAMLIPRGPIGLRHSVRVLGLGQSRPTGEVGTRHRASNRSRILFLLIVLMVVAALLLLR